MSLKASLYEEWRGNYIDYDGLKRILKARTERREWGDIDERDFVSALEAQLEKIHQFQRDKVRRMVDAATGRLRCMRRLLNSQGAYKMPKEE